MSNYYSPAPQNPIKPPAQTPDQVVKQTGSAVGDIQGIGAAKAFQDHLDKGYQAMVETMKEIPPALAPNIPDPAAYSDSEDKRVAWYSMVNDAIAKNSLLDKAQNPTASPDALATEAARAPLSPESAKAVGGEIGRMDQRQQVGAIQKAAGMFEARPAPTGIAAPNIDPKSQFGRNLKIKLSRMEPYADIIQTAATSANIPPQLVMAVAAQESGGDSNDVSATGVKGTMQVTQNTFKDMAAKYPDAGLTDRKDPKQSYTAGALFLGELMKQFGGNMEYALAAYNGGPTAVRLAVKKHGDKWKENLADFVSPPDGITADEKAKEMTDYVERVGKNFSALGGQPVAAAAKTPTQNEFNQALLKDNPNAVINPIAKEIKAGLKSDAYIEANDKKAAAAGMVQDRLMQKFRAEQDFKTYQKVNSYNKQIEKIGPAAQGIMRIDEMVGGLDNNKPIAGFGFGQKAFKKFMQTDASPEARDMRIAVANLFADIGLATSGQNFTAAEMERLESRLGNTFFSDESAFRSAIKQQRERLFQAMTNPWNALPDDVKKDLYDAGTMNPEFFGQFDSKIVDSSGNPKEAGPNGKEVATTGAKKLSPAAQAAFDKIKAKRAAAGKVKE